jgi:hypothetical protein
MLAVAYTMASHACLTGILLAFDQHLDWMVEMGAVVQWVGGATLSVGNPPKEINSLQLPLEGFWL